MSKLTLYGLLLFFGLCWGSTVPLTKIAVETGHHPFGLIFWQLVISVFLLAILAYFRKSKLHFDRQHLKFFLIITLAGTIVPNGFGFLAAFHLPGGVMALTIAMVPVFSLLIAVAIGVEKSDLKRLAGLLFGLAAVAMLVLPESTLPDPSKVAFVFVALIAPFAYGIEGNYIATSKPDETGPIASLLGASIIGTVIAFGLTLMVDGFINPLNGFGKAEYALIGSSLFHVAAYVGYIWMVGQAGPVFTSQVAYIVTPAGVILSSLFLGESHSAWLWIALAVMLVALALVQPREAD